MEFGHTCWTRRSPNYPDHSEYMEILPDVGRIVFSAVIGTDPIRNVPIAMAYRESGPGKIKTQLRPDCQWIDNTYQIDGNVVIWNHSGSKDWPWILIPCDQLPSWFSELKRRALIRMDERQHLAAQQKDSQQAAQCPP